MKISKQRLEDMKNYNKKHREIINKRSKKWYQDNKEFHKIRCALERMEWGKRNKDKIKLYNKNWNAKNQNYWKNRRNKNENNE